MKRVVGLVGLLACAGSLTACAEGTPAPVTPLPSVAPAPTAAPPAPAPPADPDPVTEGDVTVAWMHGMEILVKRTPSEEFVAAELTVRGGVRNWTKDKAGIENVAFEVATSGGTKSLAKGPFSQKLASLGASLDGGASLDDSSISTKAPLAAWDELFPIFADTFLAPALPASEFEIVKQRELMARRHETETGEGRLTLMVRKSAFAGHPYENRAVGTVESVSALKADELAPYLDKLRDTNRLVLVVVGDVDPAHVIDQAKRAFASVPRGPYVETPIPPLKFTAPHLAGDPFKLPTNYVESVYAGPTWSDPDFAAIRVTMGTLQERVFDEVRTKRNLSYGPAAGFQYRQAAPMTFLYVTAVDPNAAMGVEFAEAKRISTELIPDKELAGMKATALSSNTQHHETVDGQVAALTDALLIGGDWHLVKRNDERLKATTPEQVRAAAAKWLTNPQTVIVGDPAKLDPKVVGAQ